MTSGFGQMFMGKTRHAPRDNVVLSAGYDHEEEGLFSSA